jgi:hypothetical protein
MELKPRLEPKGPVDMWVDPESLAGEFLLCILKSSDIDDDTRARIVETLTPLDCRSR